MGQWAEGCRALCADVFERCLGRGLPGSREHFVDLLTMQGGIARWSLGHESKGHDIGRWISTWDEPAPLCTHREE